MATRGGVALAVGCTSMLTNSVSRVSETPPQIAAGVCSRRTSFVRKRASTAWLATSSPTSLRPTIIETPSPPSADTIAIVSSHGGHVAHGGCTSSPSWSSTGTKATRVNTESRRMAKHEYRPSAKRWVSSCTRCAAPSIGNAPQSQWLRYARMSATRHV